MDTWTIVIGSILFQMGYLYGKWQAKRKKSESCIHYKRVSEWEFTWACPKLDCMFTVKSSNSRSVLDAIQQHKLYHKS